MKLYFRLLLTLLKNLVQSEFTDWTQVTHWHGRTLLNDLDPNFHMNNARYVEILDVARFDWAMKTGFMKVIMKKGWLPVISSIEVKFLKPLCLGDRFNVETHVTHSDEKWFYVSQRITHAGKTFSEAKMKVVFVSRQGKIEAPKILSLREKLLAQA